MREAPKRKLLLVLMVIALLFLLLGGSYLFYEFRRERNFHAMIRKIDLALLEKNALTVRKITMRAVSFAQERLSWLRLVKRAYLATSKGIDVALYRDVARRALEAFPQDHEFAALAVSSLTWSGALREGAAVARQTLGDRYNGLKAEALLRESPEILSSFGPSSLQLDPYLLAYLGALSGDQTFLFNAALLHMGRGDYREGWRIVSDMAPSLLNEGAIFIAYDAHSYEEGLHLLQRQDARAAVTNKTVWSIKQNLADLSFLTGRGDDAKEYYREALVLDPQGHWKTYLNLAGLLLSRYEEKEAAAVLEEGLSAFPSNRHLLLFASSFTQPLSFVRQSIQRYLISFPDDLEVKLLEASAYLGERPPQNHQAALWRLFNTYPYDTKVAAHLIWFLLGIGDTQGAEIVVERSRFLAPVEWLSFYRGAIATLEKDYATALASFRQAKKYWAALYNKALLETHLEHYPDASISLNAAIERMQDARIKDRSRLFTLSAQVLRARGKDSAAKESLRKALEADPYNVRANLLMQQGKVRP